MEPTVLISALSLVASMSVGATIIVRYWWDRSSRTQEMSAAVIKARAERDSIVVQAAQGAVQTSEGALRLLEQTLIATRQSEGELRSRVLKLEQDRDTLLTKMRSLEDQRATDRRRIRFLQSQLELRGGRSDEES